MARIKPEFDRRAVKVIGLSVDALDGKKSWAGYIEETQGHRPQLPRDRGLRLRGAKLYMDHAREHELATRPERHAGRQPDRPPESEHVHNKARTYSLLAAWPINHRGRHGHARPT